MCLDNIEAKESAVYLFIYLSQISQVDFKSKSAIQLVRYPRSKQHQQPA